MEVLERQPDRVGITSWYTTAMSESRNLLILCGGADRDRTDDLLNAIQALSQLSYSPTGRKWRASAYRQMARK